MILLSSFDIPPDLDTYATLPGRYSFDANMLSIMPPVLPILKQPGFTPPTYACLYVVNKSSAACGARAAVALLLSY